MRNLRGRVLIAAVGASAALAAVGAAAAVAAFPGRNGKIVFVRSQVWTVRANGVGERRLTTDPTDKYSPAFSADGRRIAFAQSRRDLHAFWHIGVMDTDGRNRRLLTRAKADDSSPSFAADGRVAFVRLSAGGHRSIRVMDGDGSHGRTVTPRGKEPAFAPDGRRIVFEGWDTKPGDYGTPRDKFGIFIVDADGRRRRQLTRNPMSTPDEAGISMPLHIDHNPSFSPDGRRIVFVRSAPSCITGNLYVMDANGEHVHAITHASDGCGDYTDAAFSPDGKRIVADGLRVLRADGTRPHRVGDARGDSPDWQALPR